MNIKITRIINPGVVDKERLLMKVIASDDVGRYVVFDTVETGSRTISSRPRNVYWFPDREVKAGDQIVLYTKTGISTQRKSDDGSTIFFFYWGKREPLWNKPGEGAALLEIESFEYKSRI